MSLEVNTILTAAACYLLGLATNWAEIQMKRRIYRNRRRRLAKMKYA